MVSSPYSIADSSQQAGAERLPPHNLDAEQSLLGSLLLDRDAIIRVASFVKAEDFYLPANGTVYGAILDLYNRREPTDFITLSDELGRREQLDQVGGMAYLTALLNSVPTAVHVEYYGRIVERTATLRRLIDAGSAIVGIGYRDGIDTEEALDAAEKAIFEVSQKRQTKDFVSISEVLNRFFDQIDYMQQHRGDVVGVPTGFSDMDQLTGGLQKSDLVILAARPSMGKALALDTPLPTPTGWTTMGQVCVGDELLDEQGNPCRVTFVSEVMFDRTCYAVTFSDGAVIIADAEHQWFTSTRAARKSAMGARLPKHRESPYSIDQQYKRTFPGLVTTDEIRATLTTGSDNRWNHIVPAAEPLQLPDVDLPVPPYSLGAWLGDGSSACAVIYSADPEVLSSVRGEGVHVGAPKPCNGGQALAYRIDGGTRRGGDQRSSTSLQTTSRRHEMVGNKRIPAEYLRAGLAQRRDLLAGLMDTAGYVDPVTGVCELSTTNERLARDVAELVASLGWIPSLKSGRATLTGKDCGTKWQVRFSPDAPVFRLPRKAANQITKARPKARQRCIIAVDPVPTVPVKCVQVDSPSHLYLAGERMIPTHNTSLALGIAYGAAVQHHKSVGIFSLEMSAEQLVQRLLSMETGVDSHRLRLGQIDDGEWDRISRAFGRLAEANIFIDDGAGASVMDVRSKARRLQAESGLDMVIVDYLQLMSSRRSENRVQEISEISRGLKGLARELNVPVIALSQLSRAVESRSDHRPMLSDLRESGCLAGDTLVYLPDLGRYQPIAELEGQSGFRVLALNPATWRLEPRVVMHAFATGRKPVFRLRTRLGRTIVATANHKFLTIAGWRRLDELTVGTRLALPRRLPSTVAATMTGDELALLGHLIGDGCTLPRHAIQYTTNDSTLADTVVELSRTVFGDAIAPRVKRERDWIQVYLAATGRLTHGVRNPVAAWLEDLGAFGLRSYEKRVPERVFSQPDAGIARFLRHLWATDGCVHLDHGHKHYASIYYASSSEQLAIGVQSLLLRLGISAILSRHGQPGNGRDQYHVRISGKEDIDSFLRVVGVLGQNKVAHAVAITEHFGSRVANTNRDVIPREVWRSAVVPAMQQAGVTTRGLQAALGTAYCGSSLYKSNLSRDRAQRVAEIVDCTELVALAQSDVYWDEITSIEPAGETEVYDLTVEGLHNFVAANMVVHNSIEQDADIVMFIYREEKYEEDTDKKGIAEVIVAKHRNGPVGSINLRFFDRTARFADLELYQEPGA